MPKTTVHIPENIASILRRATIDGNTLKLAEQLDPKVYKQVMKVLELAGGRWVRKAAHHVFPSDPRPFLNMAVEQGSVTALRNPVVEYQTASGPRLVSAPQLFPTPRPLALRVVEEANIRPDHSLLEPSTGTAALVEAIREAYGFWPSELYMVELDKGCIEAIQNRVAGWPSFPRLNLAHADFMLCEPDRIPPNHIPCVDRIVMNPPFVNCQDIDHIQHAFRFLKPGGRLVSICANGPRQQAKLRPWVEVLDGTYEELPAGSFMASGTNVNTALVIVDLAG